MSKATKKYKRLYWLFRSLSIMVVAVPVFTYFVMAWESGDATQKLTLGCMTVLAIVFTALNVVLKYNIRSTIWLLLIGIYYCMDDIMPLVVIVACGTVLDEFVLTPGYKRFREKWTINKEIDARGS